MTDTSKPTLIGQRLPIVVDVTQVTPTGEGCPTCSEHPNFPQTHCGRPACRDAQAIAWAQQTGRDPADVLDHLGEPGAVTAASDGLCGRCAMASMCIVGRAVTTTTDSLDARVSACQAFRKIG